MFNRNKNHRDCADLERLVEKAMRGDEAALVELCRKTAADVLFKVSKIMNDIESARDISQEVLIRLCRGVHNLKSSKNFNGWLSKIIINEKNRYLAKNARHGEMINLDEYAESVMTEERNEFLPGSFMEDEEVRGIIMKGVSELPIRQREAVMLHYYGGLSITGTAEAMGVTVSCVSLSLSAARRSLRKKLQDQPFASERTGHGEVSVGAVLAGALQHEGTQFAVTSDAIISSVICSEAVLAEAALTSATVKAYSAAANAVVYAMCGAALVCAITLAVVTNGAHREVGEAGPREPLGPAGISFDGGWSYGEHRAHVNPEYASLYAPDGAAVLEWRITSAGSDEALHQGYGESVGGALVSLRESGRVDGEYNIFFLLSTEDGALYKIYRNFYIRR